MVWLVFKNSLKTRELLQHRGMILDATCLLCGNAEETMQHLYFECPISSDIWKQVLEHNGISYTPQDWRQSIRWLLRKARGRNATSRWLRKLLASTVYNIWAEWNKILHTQQRTPGQTLVHKILNAFT